MTRSIRSSAAPGARGVRGPGITQRQLAALAGVHPSTVSLALADDPRLPALTRERLKQLALDHRYAPNSAARWLRSGRTGTLGLVFWGEAHQEREGRKRIGEPLMAAVEAAVTAGFQALVIPATPDWLAGESIDQIVQRAPVDGALFLGTTHDRDGLARLVQSGFPAVHFGRRVLAGADLAFVSADYHSGSRDAVAHLIAQGHQRIAMIEDPRFVHEIETERTAGYGVALEAAGIAWDPELVIRPAVIDAVTVDVAATACTLLERGATAAFCATGLLGLDLLRACAASGISVPDSLAVCAYDDEPEAAASTPPLTSVRQPVARIATEAIELLIRLTHGEIMPTLVRHRLVPTELVVRESSGKRRA